MTQRAISRLVYDRAAAQYDAARPGYPAALFDDIEAYAALRPGARLLEVGAGPGQATLPMARRGYAIDAVELGANLARIARDKLTGYPKARVIQADFETVDLPPASYDLLFSATAFHWIDPRIRFQCARRLLKPGGSLALFWHRPVQTQASQEAVEALQAVYRRRAPELAAKYAPPSEPADVATEFERLIPQSGCFGGLSIRKHYVATAYDAEGYIRLLDTFSDHRLLEAARRQALFGEIRALIDGELDGGILRETVALLYLARRVD